MENKENLEYRKGYWVGFREGIDKSMKSKLKIVLSKQMVQESYNQLPQGKITLEEFEQGIRFFVDRMNDIQTMEIDGERN